MILSHLSLLALAAVTTSSVDARANDSGLSCLRSAVSPDLWGELEVVMGQMMAGDYGAVVGNRTGDLLTTELNRAADGCAERLGWTRAKRDVAFNHAIFELGLGNRRAKLAEHGIAADALDQFARDNADRLLTGAATTLSADEADRLIENVRAAGIGMDNAAVEGAVIDYFETLMAIARLKRDFAAL